MLSISASECICPDRILLFTMKMHLGRFLVLATFVAACNAGCYVQTLDMPTDDSPPGCKDDDGKHHPLKSSWRTSDCQDCFCEENEITCCNIAPMPVEFDRKKCQVILNEENCTFSVVEYKDPQKSCDVHGWNL
ncbi:beta-microseminoprotein-like [Octodon degus]|uniref:Beta-microseminoprotein n=1 Tax=Octodon degus TaxID=10160 RepID=A0A6P6DTI6_OCTDE|nr:beta-microseminoprotein-like [Octodon degus]